VRDDHAIGRVPARDNAGTNLPEAKRHFAADGNLGIVIDDGLGNEIVTGRIDLPDATRNGEVEAVPVERYPPRAAPVLERFWNDCLP